MKTTTLVALGALLTLAALAPAASARYCDHHDYDDPTGTVELDHDFCIDPNGSPIVGGGIEGHVGPKPVVNYYWVG